MSKFVGIDPGSTGAIAVVENNKLILFNLKDKNTLEIANFLKKHNTARFALEEVSPSFKGIAYNKARESYIQLKTLLEIQALPFQTFRPNSANGWMRVWSADIKAQKPKTQAQKKARSLQHIKTAYPAWAKDKELTHDQADAICIALCAQITW
jgi:hypothetical protein